MPSVLIHNHLSVVIIMKYPSRNAMIGRLDIGYDFICLLQHFYISALTYDTYVFIGVGKCSTSDELSIMFDGQRISLKPHDVHLGQIIGPKCGRDDDHNVKNDFTKKVNVLISTF